MRIQLNGEARELTEGLTVSGLLETLGFNPQGAVVERNADIVDRADYANTSIADGDTIEVVRFVGGG